MFIMPDFRARARACVALFWIIGIMAGGAARAQPLIVAHRGASKDAPENTLAAFNLAWQQGADAIEADFQLTKDGAVVCCHDLTTKHVSDQNLAVAETNLDRLRQLDVGAWKGPRWRGQRMPVIDEVLAAVPDGKKIFIEIKCGPNIFPPLKAALEKSKLRHGQAVIIAFDPEIVAEAKRQIPQLKAVWLTCFKKDRTTDKWKPSAEQVLATLERINADGVSAAGMNSVIDASLFDKIRHANYQFHVGTIDDPSLAEGYRRLGADSITTNTPSSLRHLSRRKE